MSGVELGHVCRLEVRLQEPLAQRCHWKKVLKQQGYVKSTISSRVTAECGAHAEIIPSGKLMGLV